MRSKLSFALALAAAMVMTAPAFAGQNGSDYLNYMRAGKAKPALQSAPVSARLPAGWPSHRYQGSRAFH